MTKRENDAIWAAAEEANRKFGQWMPQLWIEIFIKELASTPPATPAGLGADEIARACDDLRGIGHCGESTSDKIARQRRDAVIDEVRAAILALLSRGSGIRSDTTHEA